MILHAFDCVQDSYQDHNGLATFSCCTCYQISFLPEHELRYVRVFTVADLFVVCNVGAPYSGG